MRGKFAVKVSENMLRRVAFSISIIALLMVAGCADLCRKPSQPAERGSEQAVTEAPSVAMTVPTQEETTPSPASDERITKAEPSAQAEEQKKRPVSEPDLATSVSKLESAPPAPSAPPAVVPAKVPKAVPEQVQEQAIPPLDLELLEKRLKETSAIGFFTKIALKDQVDELLDKFRAFYEGRSSFSLAQLRQPFDLLIMKVLALLQDSDPQLANDILASREAIWNILSDREKFAKI